MSDVYISYDASVCNYPDATVAYSPRENFCEYPFVDDGAVRDGKGNNNAYALVRDCLQLAGYDAANYGTPSWNPLGDVIASGNTVLIKPNWVMHYNHNDKYSGNLDCLVTNPAVLRAIIDYVVIALKGTGRIIVADAPMQGCNLEDLLDKYGYNKLFDFYKQRGIAIEVADLRKYRIETIKRGINSSAIMNENSAGAMFIDLADDSMHAEKDSLNISYKVSDYRIEDTQKYHHGGKHCYEVNRLAIEADVIINVPKPKTHRLAGMTAAVKNLVGIIHEKACLPHRVPGDKLSGKGDAYEKPSRWKELMHLCDEKRTASFVAGRYIRAIFYDYAMKACYVMGVTFSGDKYRIGSWHGNDTIWRTSVDLNHILLYADKDGKLQPTQQRRIITIADMIVCGQRNGPVAPEPKPLGMVMLADNPYVFDRTMCEIMGFDAKKLPMFTHPDVPAKFGLEAGSDASISISLNGARSLLLDWRPDASWKFVAHDCWRGNVEKE